MCIRLSRRYADSILMITFGMFVIALDFFPGPKYMYLYYVIYADRKCFSRARAQEPFLKKQQHNSKQVYECVSY